MAVIPRPNQRFFTINYGFRGSWPKNCLEIARPEQTLHGGVLLVKVEGSDLTTNDDVDANTNTPASDGADHPACREGPTATTYTAFQPDTGRRVVEVVVVEPFTATLAVNTAATEAVLTGGECDEKIALK